MEEQDKITEMEEQEKKELEYVKETLREEDLTWEKEQQESRSSKEQSSPWEDSQTVRKAPRSR